MNAGIIRPELVKAWTGMRNSAIHASGLGPVEIKLVYKQYQTALTLLNELVMLLIGYQGAYTGYSVVGWPQREWTGMLGRAEAGPTSSNETDSDIPPVAE